VSEPRPISAAIARRRWALQTFLLLAIVWLALAGLDAFALGLLFAALGAAFGAWLVPGQPYPWRPLRLAEFALYFLRESLRGGVDVAWRVLHPRMPIDPVYVEHRTNLPRGQPRSVFVATVNLLPGTLCVRLSEDGRLRVHALVPGAGDELGTLEQHVHRLFSLDAIAAPRA
jgi:multicomponent Na+:H+ antiporter subunit E